MSDRMYSRGPDAEGLWISSSRDIGLAHRRLSIIDLSDAAVQPMTDGSSGYQIVFNGEIYNFRELREELQRSGVRFNSLSDTEVILRLYMHLGNEAFGKLRGMYAISIWNPKDRSLVLARDPYGIKPLYYSLSKGIFRFASQVKALKGLSGGPSDPAPAGHVGFFLLGSVPEPWTLHSEILALKPGHLMTVSEAGLIGPTKFANVTDVLLSALQESTPSSREEALSILKNSLEDSVIQHLTSDVPIAVFLSGGLDSSYIAEVGSRYNEKIMAVTIGFRDFVGTSQDETGDAERFAKRIGIRHHCSIIEKNRFLENFDSIIESMDQPSIDGINTWFVANQTKNAGFKVALSGVGGDELLASYNTFKRIPAIKRWYKIAFGSQAREGRSEMMTFLVRIFGKKKYLSLFEYGGSLESVYFMTRSLFHHSEITPLLTPGQIIEGLAKLKLMESMREFSALPESQSSRISISAAQRLAITSLESGWYLRNQLLRDADWAGMANSVEIRTPFVDFFLLRRVVSQIRSFPDLTKNEVLLSASSRLSKFYSPRPKTGFTVPVYKWLADNKKYRDYDLKGWATLVYSRFA